MGEPKAMIRGRITFGRSSSLAPEVKNQNEGIQHIPGDITELNSAKELEQVAGLLYCACKGDIHGIEQLLQGGLSVDAADFDNRTALHLAACEGHVDVVQFLINKGANVNCVDQWGSTPLADAMHYGNKEVCKLLNKEIPEYEINPSQLISDVTKCKMPAHRKYRVSTWHGTRVAVKVLPTSNLTNEALMEFRAEIDLLQRLRHPNVVQFLGAVTQNTPMMIVTEFLPQMDLAKYLKEEKRLDPERAVSYALDIARGMNYLHENKPPVVHRDLKPSNLLRDTKHLKVANFGLSLPIQDSSNENASNSTWSTESLRAKPVKRSCRYMAPELYASSYRNEQFDTSVDVFSFALIVQEMMEGCPPFHNLDSEGAAKAYAEHRRPPFRQFSRSYPHDLKNLIEECWHKEPSKRPSFSTIIPRLTKIQSGLIETGFFKNITSAICDRLAR